MSISAQTKYFITAVVLAALAFGAGIWLNRQQSTEPEDIVSLLPDLSCNLRASPCRMTLPDGGWVEFAITPQNLPPMEPLQLDVVVDGTGLEALWVDFVGPEMDMGFNRAKLEERKTGEFSGAGMVPVCVRDRMLWEARVILSDGDTWINAPFRFEVIR